MSEQTTAANLDEVIETQMKQSESAWTRKTDGIDYKQSRSSVFLANMNFELYFSKILFSLYTEIKYEISLFYLKIFFTFCLFCPLLFLPFTLFLSAGPYSLRFAAVHPPAPHNASSSYWHHCVPKHLRRGKYRRFHGTDSCRRCCGVYVAWSFLAVWRAVRIFWPFFPRCVR